MVRSLKPKIHIFFQEASNKGKKINICEDFYIKHSFVRNVKNVQITSYPNSGETEFNKAIKERNKKNSLTKDDKFFIVLDTDIKPGRANLADVRSQISKLQQKFGNDAKIILSGRSFEVWLCMYDRSLYTKPFITQDILNKDVDSSYSKNEDWYRDNAEKYYLNYQNAKKASILSKQHVIKNNPINISGKIDLVNNYPPFSMDIVINYLSNLTPFTYMEQLIDEILEYE